MRGAPALAALFAACLSANAAQARCPPAQGAFSASARSSGGGYVARVSSGDLKVNRPASLSIAIARRDGRPLSAGADIKLRLLMPAHGHGMTTRPVLKRSSPSAFDARGILLHMAGEWTIFLDVTEGQATEKVEICVTA